MAYSERLHDAIIEFLISELGSKANCVAFIMETLSISKSAAYRKVNSRSQIGLDELQELQKRINIPLKEMVSPTYESITFSGDVLRKLPNTYIDYLHNIIKNLNILSSLGVKIYTSSNNIPPFHFINFPILYYFKLFYWNKMYWNFNSIPHFDIQFFKTNRPLMQAVEKVGEIYFSIPSTEIWTPKMFDGMISQIISSLKTGEIKSQEIAIQLLEELKKLSNHLENTLENGRKKMSQSLHCQSNLEVNTIPFHDGAEIMVFESTSKKFNFLRIDGPNFIRTGHNDFNEHIMDWFDRIQSYSTNITGKRNFYRNEFFSKVTSKIDQSISIVKELKSSSIY